ncbi:hypothetical protein NQ176_g5805 [Zarea fungicola]|uniref:Uncharacterized protein n=1 Tax=Zarea fungicola TaxID=93591 RepID=A0ACC1N8H5_9HYPO|nr:hypothetical protein NQ176_g5805 [Lecanicillium fungicola]
MDSARRASASGSSSRRQRSSSTSSTASTASTESSIADDDLDLIANAAIPNGFRPGASGSVTTNPLGRRAVPLLARPLLPPPQAVNPSFSKWNHRPSSVSKPPRQHDSLAIRADGSNAANTSQTGGENGVPPLRLEAPYRGPSNPVHPYGMYPQRTASNATDRSNRSSRTSYTGPGGTNHPYTANQQAIPVGFNGLTAPYEPHIGPDGEDVGDLLGPLGHTEELPPYTRYPEVAFTAKPGTSTAAAANAPVTSATPTAIDPVPVTSQPSQEEDVSGRQPPADPATILPATAAPAAAITTETTVAVATVTVPATGAHESDAVPENPFASPEDALIRTNSRRSNRSMSPYRDNSSEASFSEKEPRTQTKWQRRARKKLWGIIPYWTICLVFVGMIIMGIVMGAAVGTVLKGSGKTKSGQKPDKDQNPTPTAVDIQPLPTVPPNLLPLPVGPFLLPQLDGGRTRRFCINDTTQLPAWSCNIPFSQYSFNIVQDPHQAPIERYNLTISPLNMTQSQFIWGTQPPLISNPVKLKLVNESTDWNNRGPAWWATVSYDKTVMVQEHDLELPPPPPPPAQKRGWFYSGPEAATVVNGKTKSMKDSTEAQFGDKMWICTWPGTILEIMVYPGQNTSAAANNSSATPSKFPSSTGSDGGKPNHPLSPYPKVVKMLERRIANCGPAKCRKYEMLQKKALSLSGPDGKPIEFVINENSNPVHGIHRPNIYASREEHEYLAMEETVNHLSRRNPLMFTPCGCFWSQ